MIDKQTQRTLESLLVTARSTTVQDGVRLEAMADALRIVMRAALATAAEAKSLWNDTGLEAITLAAGTGESVAGSTYTREAILLAQMLFNSFDKWSRVATMDITDPDTEAAATIALPATPRQIFMQQPEKISI